MVDFMFKSGNSYIGTSSIDKKRQKVFCVVGRNGRSVSFSNVNSVRRDVVDDFDGVEVAKVKDADGFDYVMSARQPVDVDGAFGVVEMCVK